MEIGQFSAVFSSFQEQLDALMLALFCVGLFLGMVWIFLPNIFRARIKTAEVIYWLSILSVIIFLSFKVIL